MELVMDILGTVLPLLIVGGIAVFVILRLKHKLKKGTLGKKKSEGAQILLGSLIPFGMMIGLLVAMFLSVFIPFTFLSAIAWGPGIGMLFGYFAYEIYSRMGESYSQ